MPPLRLSALDVLTTFLQDACRAYRRQNYEFGCACIDKLPVISVLGDECTVILRVKKAGIVQVYVSSKGKESLLDTVSAHSIRSRKMALLLAKQIMATINLVKKCLCCDSPSKNAVMQDPVRGLCGSCRIIQTELDEAVSSDSSQGKWQRCTVCTFWVSWKQCVHHQCSPELSLPFCNRCSNLRCPHCAQRPALLA